MKRCYILFFTFVLFFSSITYIKADLINPEVFTKKCEPNEVTVKCNFKGTQPFVYTYDECKKYNNNPDYRYLTGTGSSFGGYSIYCFSPSSIFSTVAYHIKEVLPLLAITLILEYFVLLIFFKKNDINKELKHAFLVANFISYTLFYIFSLLLSYILPIPFLIVLALEILVILFESKYIFNKVSNIEYKRLLKYSIIANIISAIFGTLVYRLFETFITSILF